MLTYKCVPVCMGLGMFDIFLIFIYNYSFLFYFMSHLNELYDICVITLTHIIRWKYNMCIEDSLSKYFIHSEIFIQTEINCNI